MCPGVPNVIVRQNHSIPDVLSKLAERRSVDYSQYPAWFGCRRSADVPRADHDRVGSSPWQGGFKERVYCACLPSICLIFSTCKYAATAFNFKHKKTINVTDFS